MRCFLAIELPEEIKNELTKVQEQLKDENVKAVFVKPENLHLTLKFLGEIDDFQVNKIKQALKQIKFEPFKIRLNSLGFFTPRFVRVLWIDVLPKEQLLGLQQSIDEVLYKQGFKKDKSFESHITLARVKWVKDKQELIAKLRKIKVKPLEFEVKSFVLKKSTLTPKGPVYEDVVKFEKTKTLV